VVALLPPEVGAGALVWATGTAVVGVAVAPAAGAPAWVLVPPPQPVSTTSMTAAAACNPLLHRRSATGIPRLCSANWTLDDNTLL